MQDNFSYNKIQGGSSLFMKSDSDGVFDAVNRKTDLVIKSSSEGLQYFTDWDAISTSIQQKNLARFEDSQPTKLNFSCNEWNGNYSFSDEWSASDIKILDDIAIVAYEDYTDIHRTEINWPATSLKQYAEIKEYYTSSNNTYYSLERRGGLKLGDIIIRQDKVYPYNIDQLTEASVQNTDPDYDSVDAAINFNSTILKVQLSGTVNDGASNIDAETKTNLPRVMYFVFGGFVDNEADYPILNYEDIKYNSVDYDGSRSLLSNAIGFNNSNYPAYNPILDDESEISYSILKDKLNSLEGGVVGKFYLVPQSYNDLKANTDTFAIELSIQSNYGLDEKFASSGYIKDGLYTQGSAAYTTLFTDVFKYNESGGYRYHKIDLESATLIKLQPVRKCGKVDVYTKKKGIAASVVGNKIQSIGHDLSTNDIIEISSALYDEASIENFTVSKHPMNGKKFVKVVDDDNFEIYDDQFFKDPTNTLNLRTTDGIKWIAIGDSFGSLAQSWNYHGTLFSPSGRNGYRGLSSTSTADSLSELNSYFTTKRPLKSDVSPSLELSNDGSINLNFDISFNRIVNTLYAKNIDGAIPKNFESYDTPLNDTFRFFNDFYPYNCQDKESDSDINKGPYKGCKFGSALDFKFSHKSGNSSVYTLAISEPCSDVSVDLFGLFDEDNKNDRRAVLSWSKNSDSGFLSSRDTAYLTRRRRVVPWHLPYGRVHIFTVTVDQYNNITDISHKNTIFGGGYDLLNSSNVEDHIEKNPWKQFEIDCRNYYYNRYFNIYDYAEIMRVYFGEFKESLYFSDLFSRTENVSRYWIRSAVVAWDLASIRKFRDNSEPSENSGYYRYLDVDRALSTTTSGINDLNIYSRFGFAGYSFTPPVYEKIDRFAGNSNAYNPSDQTYKFIFPWVDSFGKSVALKNSSLLSSCGFDGFNDEDPKTILVAGSTTRSNIEINTELNQPILVGPEYMNEADCRSGIGQLTAIFLYKDDAGEYQVVDFTEINSGGSNSGRFFTNSLIGNKLGTQYKYLPLGYDAGLGLAEVTTSCHLSASQIEFIGDYLVWTDQRLRDNVSTVNILKYDDTATQIFKPSRTISRNFNFPRSASNPATLTTTAYNAGDGFGFKFKTDIDLFVTNCMDTKTDLGFSISDYSDLERIDTLQVYEYLSEEYKFTQKISPSIYANNNDYPLKLRSDYSDYLIDLPNVNYDNNTLNTYTWNIDLSGRYDIANKKILVKDPLEYSLFSRNYSVSEIDNVGNAGSENGEIYLAMYEKTKLTPQIYNQYSSGLSTADPVDPANEDGVNGSFLLYEYISENTNEFLVEDYGGGPSEQKTARMPLLFFNLPLKEFDHLDSITINYKLDIGQNIATFQKTDDEDSYIELTNLVPRIVLYKEDPRMTVMRSGPSSRGSSTSLPSYTNGLWTKIPDINTTDELFAYQFPGWYRGGAQDLFFYSKLPGSFINSGSVSWPVSGNDISYLYGGEKNLGEYYDLTKGVRGNLSPDTLAGDPAWISPDVYHELSEAQKQSLIPYAKLFTPTSSSSVDNTITFSLTLTRDQVKDYIIKGSAIKNIGRPTSNDNFIGSSTFDDSDNTFGVVNEDEINYTLIVGLCQTNITSFDVNTGVVNYVDIPTINPGPLKYINPSDPNNLQQEYLDARYPYCHHALFYQDTFEGRKYTGEYLDYSIKSSVDSITLSLNKTTDYKRRYSNKFHKIAAFDYAEESANDIRLNYSESVNASEKDFYGSFGFDRFVPAISSVNKNPIISISRKTENNSDRLQILNSETVENIDSSYFVDPESGDLEYNVPPTGMQIGTSNFNKYSLLGSFDISDEKYVPLFIKANPTEDAGINLYVEGSEIDTKTATLVTIPKSVQTSNIPIFIGQTSKESGIPLFLKSKIGIQRAPLFIEEIQPSSIATLFTRSVDFDGNINLSMNPQYSGVPPLYIAAPKPANNGISLVYTEYDTQESPLFIDGVFGEASGIPAYLSGVFAETGDMSLVFSPGFSGVTPLAIGARFSSGNAPLVVYSHDNTNSNISLYTRTPEESGVSLYMINKTYNDSNDLFVNGVDTFTSLDTLFIDGSTGSGHTSRVSLFIGQDIDSDNSVSLFLKSLSGGTGVGGSTVYGDDAGFFVSGGLNYNSKNNTSFFLKVPGTGIVNEGMPISLKVNEPTFGPGGGILSSGDIGLYMDGNNDAGIYYKLNRGSTLYMQSYPLESGAAPLYIERPTTDIVPLYINSAYDSGNINVYISGNYTYNDNIGLFIKPPESNDFRFFLRGYLE